MLYGAVCSGTDTHVIHGTFQEEEVVYPSIIGHESVGEVIEVGSAVRNFAPGDHITRVSAQESSVGVALSWGGMCEFGVARDHVAMRQDGLAESEWADYSINQVIPSGIMTPAHEPMVITWRETHDYMRRLAFSRGERILISGSGANGLSLAAMGVLLGGQVTLIGSASRRIETERVGARAIDYRSDAAVAELIDREAGAYSVVIDATGKSGSLDRLLPVLRPEATLGVYGMDDFDSYTLRPLRASSFRFYNDGYYEPDAHEPVMALIRDGQLDASVWIREEEAFDWSNIASAYAAAQDRSLVKPVVRLFD
jgi:threonine dehydrogenase-like Zn-dependent dehydrogenase